MTLEGETSVQEARDKVAHALAEKLISGSGARVIDANDWNVDFHPPGNVPHLSATQPRLTGCPAQSKTQLKRGCQISKGSVSG
jgi:hypothetical protein